MPFTDPVPAPVPPVPPANLVWVDAQGRLTREAQNYLQRLTAYLATDLTEFLEDMAAAIP